LEVIAYAQGFSQFKQLEYFSLKILQYIYLLLHLLIERNPNISEECIEKFAEVVSKLDNLSNFDLYFRR